MLRKALSIPSLVAALCVPLRGAQAAFDPGDLAGAWSAFVRWDLPGAHDPGWERLTLTLAANGSALGGSFLDSEANAAAVTGGAASLAASGRVDGSFTLNAGAPIAFEAWQLDLGETLIAGVGTDAQGFASLGLALRPGPSYSNADLLGSWTLFGLSDERSTHVPAWFRAELVIANAASPVANGTAFHSDDPSEALSDIPISLGAGGLAQVPLFGLSFQMDAGKTAMAWAQSDTQDPPVEYLQLQLLLKHGSGFSAADLEGVWRVFTFGDDRAAPEPFWERATLILDASGAVVAGLAIDSDGNRGALSGGNLAVTGDGRVSGTLDFEGGGSSALQDFRLDADGHLLAGVSSDGDGRALVIALPEPAAGLPAGLGALLFLSARRRRASPSGSAARWRLRASA